MKSSTSNQEHSEEVPSFDWLLWVKWILVSTLGWAVGLALISWRVEATAVAGVVVGVMQWLVLRSLVREADWWIVATAGGWAIGWIVTIMPFLPDDVVVLDWSILGLAVGAAQWLVLRRWVVHQAGWWVVISTLGWAVGPILGLPLVGGVVGAVTGLALELLLRYPRPGMVKVAEEEDISET